MIVLFVSFLLVLTAGAGELRYCIQAATEKDFDTIKSYYRRVEEFPEARIEKRGNLYLLRVGAEEKRKNLMVMYRKVKNLFPDAYIKKCEIDEKYVVYPETEKKEEVPAPDKEKPQPTEETKQIEKNAEIKPIVEELKDEIETLKEDIEEIKNILEERKANTQAVVRAEDPAYFEKFLYSVGIFIGGLFFFTWILLILLYRKVGSVNLENANLLNDMFRLIKVLNLLGKGKVIKMEGGKLMVYDPKTDKWNEVE